MKPEFKVLAVSPSKTTTPLQFVCFFDQTKNQNYAGGTELVDLALEGRIRRLRADDCFRGHRFETLLISPKTLGAERLMLVGLGDPSTFALHDLETLGELLVKEAAKLNVESFAYAPSLKDADFLSFATDDVSSAVVRGMHKGLRALHALAQAGLVAPLALREIQFLAGAAHLEAASAGLQRALALEE
jgi:Cytosol aminopeptidase family, N-terminal domain